MFSKGQTVTFKKRGAHASVKQYAGQSAQVVRGGKNVTLSITDTETGMSSSFKVPAEVLASSTLSSK